MAGFDLAKLGLKKFDAQGTKTEVNANPVSSGNPSDVGGNANPKADATVETQAPKKPASLTFNLKTIATPPASDSVAKSETLDVFDLASTQVAPPVPSVIEPEEEAVVESTPDGMRAKLDKLDKMIVANSGVDQMSIDTARNYVQDIMVELKTHPEYSGVLIDKDIHNIMTFVRSSLSITQKTFVQTQEKRQKSAAKKASTAKFDLSGLGDSSLEAPVVNKQTKQLQQTSEAGLDAFANLNVDSIVAKMKK